ncbi:MAG: 2-oxoglutarate dehydrogenase E1 component, partial [Phycisphaerae bacterium]|nr:2-oxoglutarate dehydrogenase E1 component [Phycisphaerae bacterium]
DGATGASAGAAPAPEPVADAAPGRSSQSKVDSLIYNYRDLGHLAAELDPLGSERPFPEQLTLESFGLSDGDLHREFDPGSLPLENPAPLAEIASLLEQTFCRHIGVEFMHVQDRDRRRWLGKRMEAVRNRPSWTPDQKRHILKRLVAADAFESFLDKRYIGKKRFGLEGGESLIVILDQILELGPALGIREFALGMAHRGRLNVLANILHKRFDQIFTEFDEAWIEDFVEGGGDVKYHQGYSSDHLTLGGQKIHLTLAANPSHLEFATSVVQGRCRAKQRLLGDTEGRSQVVPVILHGDAAFPGQGVVAECFNMAGLEGYTVGGTVHVVINNQVGFTTDQKDLYTGRYCTEIAKMANAPIFHVNGDDAESCAWVARLALEYRQTFRTDVVIDMWCYRKNGHNETDEPSFTQPVMYQAVRRQVPVVQKYRAQLQQEGVITDSDFDGMYADFQKEMDEAQTRTKSQPVDPSPTPFQSQWSGMVAEYREIAVDTAVPKSTLQRIAAAIGEVPDHIEPHKTVSKLLRTRVELGGGAGVDWGLAEALAFGSLLLEGIAVRVTGQDVERGTFSHRHAVVNCQKTGAQHVPLNTLSPDQAKFCVHNSPLTEAACVGFEFGYSVADPRMLIIWEAQFGDFANGAQVIIDQFLASAEAKWARHSGLTLFLPHGYEGQGPEHSSARLERYLQLCAAGNMQVVYPSTSAQFFHVLRRQMKRNFRKPLVVMTPKSLLRHAWASSPVAEFTSGSFRRLIVDESVEPSKVNRLIFCSGKIVHELRDRRKASASSQVALACFEQLYPFPEDLVSAELDRFPKAELLWVQEEPRNMGAWTFVRNRFLDRFGRDLRYVGRGDAASPAVGSSKMHAQQQEKIVAEAVGAEAKSGGTADSKASAPAGATPGGAAGPTTTPDAPAKAASDAPAKAKSGDGRAASSREAAAGKS